MVPITTAARCSCPARAVGQIASSTTGTAVTGLLRNVLLDVCPVRRPVWEKTLVVAVARRPGEPAGPVVSAVAGVAIVPATAAASGGGGSGVGSGRRVDLLDELGEPVLVQVAGQVGLADDADQAVVVAHRQPLDVVVFHLVQHLADVGGGLDPEQRALSQLTGSKQAGVAAFGDAPHHDVAVGQDAVQPVVGAADRQRADAQIAHLLRGGRDGVVLADA